MLALLGKLKKKLYEINYGSFEIDGRETERVKIYNERIRCCKIKRGL